MEKLSIRHGPVPTARCMKRSQSRPAASQAPWWVMPTQVRPKGTRLSGRVVSSTKVFGPSARQAAMVGMRMRAWAAARGSKCGASFLKARS